MDKISPIQLFWFYVQAQIGVGILTLPNDVDLGRHSDGWLSVLGAGLVLQAIILMCWLIHLKNPSLSYFKILERFFGPFIGKIITCFYIVYFILTASMVLMSFSSVLKRWTNPDTPKLVIVSIITILSLYAVSSSLKVLARYITILSPMIFLSAVFASYGFYDSDPLYMLPLFQSDWYSLAKGSILTVLALDGFIILLILFPEVNAPNKSKLLAATYANLFVISLYTFIVISTYIYFGPSVLNQLKEPFLFLIRTVSIFIIERIDLLFLAFWVLIISSTMIIYLFMVVAAMSELNDKIPKNYILIGLGLLLIIGTPIPENALSIDRITGIVEKVGILFIMVIPLIVSICSVLTPTYKESKKAGEP